MTMTDSSKMCKCSLHSWRDFVRECFCFGSEAVNASGEAVRGLVKSRVLLPARNMAASPAHASRQLRRLVQVLKRGF